MRYRIETLSPVHFTSDPGPQENEDFFFFIDRLVWLKAEAFRELYPQRFREWRKLQSADAKCSADDFLRDEERRDTRIWTRSAIVTHEFHRQFRMGRGRKGFNFTAKSIAGTRVVGPGAELRDYIYKAFLFGLIGERRWLTDRLQQHVPLQDQNRDAVEEVVDGLLGLRFYDAEGANVRHACSFKMVSDLSAAVPPDSEEPLQKGMIEVVFGDDLLFVEILPRGVRLEGNLTVDESWDMAREISIFGWSLPVPEMDVREFCRVCNSLALAISRWESLFLTFIDQDYRELQRFHRELQVRIQAAPPNTIYARVGMGSFVEGRPTADFLLRVIRLGLIEFIDGMSGTDERSPLRYPSIRRLIMTRRHYAGEDLGWVRLEVW